MGNRSLECNNGRTYIEIELVGNHMSIFFLCDTSLLWKYEKVKGGEGVPLNG